MNHPLSVGDDADEVCRNLHGAHDECVEVFVTAQKRHAERDSEVGQAVYQAVKKCSSYK
jgi:hypothetical protein